MKKQLLRNLISNYFSSFLGMALGFALVPFLIHKLGKEAFGLTVLAESTIVFFELVTVSVKLALARYATFSLAQGDQRDFEEFLSTGRAILYLSSLAAVVIGILLSAYFPSLFRVPPSLTSDSRYLFLFISCGFTISIPNMVFWSVLYSRHRYDLINGAKSAGVILRALSLFAAFCFLPTRFVSLSTYGAIYLLMIWTENTMVYFWHKKVMPGLRISARDWRPDKVREILSYSSYVALGQASAMMYQNTTNVLINLFWGPAANAVYAISAKFPQIMTRLFQEATWSLTSSFNEMVARHEHDRIKALYYMYTKYLTILTSPICLALILLSKLIIHLWVGDSFAQAGRLMPILTIPLFVQLPLSVSGCMFSSYAKVKLPSLVSLSVALLNLGLGVLLGKVFSLGLLGMAVSAASCITLYLTFFSAYYACRITGIPYGDYLLKSFALPLLWACAVVLGCLAVVDHSQIRSLPLQCALCAAFLAAYYAGAYAWVLDPLERKRLVEMAREARKKVQEKWSGFVRGEAFPEWIG